MTTPKPRTPPPEGSIDTQVIDDQIQQIGLNRPAKRNGCTPRMFRELGEAYTRLDDDPTLRVGVLHAFGEHFTAGLDLPLVVEHLQRGEPLTPYGLVEPHELGLPGYRRRQKPMIAAVQGICFTVGIELMLAADIAIAADNCRFSQMEVQRAILPAGGATLRMAERAGVGNAMLHLLTADQFDSAEALRCHFVQKVVPAAELLDSALPLARHGRAYALSSLAQVLPGSVWAPLSRVALYRQEGVPGLAVSMALVVELVVLGLAGLAALAVAGVLGAGLVALRAAGVSTLGPWGVLGAFGTLVGGVAGVSILNLGITFNYLVSLFHREPVRQGLFGRPGGPELDRAFGWLGLAAMAAGAAAAAAALYLGMHGWDITRTWLWLLGGALGVLVGLQLAISWVLMRVLEDLSVRDARAQADFEGQGD